MLRLVLVCLGLQSGLCAAAMARPAPHVRLGLALDVVPRLQGDVEALVLPHLAPGMHLVDRHRYMAMADQLGVLFPYTPSGARRIGRALHLSHVVLVQRATRHVAGHAHSDLYVRLVDVRTGRLAVNSRFALTDGTLQPPSAARVVAALRWMLLAERADPNAPLWTDPRRSLEAAGPAARAEGPQLADAAAPPAGQQAQNMAPGSPASAPAVPAPSAPEATPDAAQTPTLPEHANRRALSVAPTVSFRRAQLTGTDAPCYCTRGGFAPAMSGVALATDVYFDPNTTHLGLELQAALAFAHLPVSASGTDEVSTSIPWQVGGAVGYRLFEHALLTLAPHLGAAYARFPISRGPFVGAGYTTVFVGARLMAPLLPHFQLSAGGDFAIVAHAGYELHRLGILQAGTQWQVTVQPQVLLGRWTVGVTAGIAQTRTVYAGRTALYASQVLHDVKLTDTTLAFALNLGGRL